MLCLYRGCEAVINNAELKATQTDAEYNITHEH